MKTLNKTIRKNLLEAKENKKNLIVEEKIIRGRFNFLLESLSEKDELSLDEIFFTVLFESQKLRSLNLTKSLILEEEKSFFSSLFSLFGGGIVDSLKEYGARWIIENTFGEENANSLLAQTIVAAFGNLDWETITKIFTDCSFTTKWLVKTIVEGFARKYQEKSGMSGVFADTVRNGIVDAINSNEVIDALSNKLMGFVCSMIGKLVPKMEDAYSGIKQKVVKT